VADRQYMPQRWPPIMLNVASILADCPEEWLRG